MGAILDSNRAYNNISNNVLKARGPLVSVLVMNVLLSADLFRPSRVLGFQKQTIQHPTYQPTNTAKPNRANQPTN